MSFDIMKVCVTGGLGYFGSVLVPELIKNNHDVVVLDKNLFDKKSDAEVVTGDIRDSKLVEKTLQGSDAVVHLAAMVGQPICDLDKESAININFLATKNIANICKKMGIKLIFASTCSVYGAKPRDMLTEQSGIAPLSVYGMSKIAAEESILRLMDEDFKPIIFRMGTLFGYSPRMRFDLVINLFVGKAIQEKEITVFGGNQWRPFPHLIDAALVYEKALSSKASGIYNLGGNNFQISEIAEIIREHTGCDVKTIKELEDKRNYRVSSEKVKKEFGISFKNDIKTAIGEIKNAFESGRITNYKSEKYNNAKAYTKSEKIRRLIKEAGLVG
jgi:nucleoside-diphosphate-sugar epimerase